MPDPINGQGHQLIGLVNQQCGYKNVWVDNNTTARWSNKGNLVVEDNTKGTECSCRDGMVLASNQPLNHGSQVPRQQVEFEPRRNEGYNNSGRVRELIQFANAAKHDTRTYAEQDSQVSQFLERAIDLANTPEDIIAIADAAKTDSATYAGQDRIVGDAMAKGSTVLNSAWDAVKLADTAKRDSATYAVQDRAVESVLKSGASTARGPSDFATLRSAASRDTGTYAAQDRITRTIARAETDYAMR